MKQFPDQIPEWIFDLSSLQAYQSLSQEQKNAVNEWMDASEYDDLYLASQFLSDSADVSAPQIVEKKPVFKRPWTHRLTTVRIWQAACVILATTLVFVLTRKPQTLPAEILVKKEIIRDTLYIDRPVQLPAAVTRVQAPSAQSFRSVPAIPAVPKIASSITKIESNRSSSPDTVFRTPEIPILAIDNLNDVKNRPKRTSRIQDSMERQFPLVSL